MVRINFLIAMALATGSLAASNCQAQDNACRTAHNANMAQCSADKAACCSTAFDDCRTAPDANMSYCASENSACKNQK